MSQVGERQREITIETREQAGESVSEPGSLYIMIEYEQILLLVFEVEEWKPYSRAGPRSPAARRLAAKISRHEEEEEEEEDLFRVLHPV